MIQSVLSNLAIILLMHLFIGISVNARKELTDGVFRMSIILIISAAVISMFYLPISYGEYQLDMRFIPLVFLAYLWGWKYVLPTLLIVSLWSFLMDGSGVMLGIIFGMVGPTLLVLAFHHRAKLKGKHIEKIVLVIACWFISDVPIIFLTPNGFEMFKEIAVLRLCTFVATAIILYIFIMHERQRRMLNERLQKLVGEDPLTRLLNKRRFYEVLEEKLKNKNLSHHYIAMLDLDHFKRLNDTYGHIIGDDVLIKVGQLLKRYEQEHLKIGRYGGEEFILYIGNESVENVVKKMEEIRTDIEETCFILEEGKKIRVTASIGLAPIEEDVHIYQSIHHADKNLYLAKKNGRNQVVSAWNITKMKTS